MTAATALVAQQSCEPVRDLAKHQLDVLDTHVAEINRLGRRCIADSIEIGRRLHACKGVVGHGNWGPWLKEKFGWSERTALNFIRVYELAKTKSANFADLNLRGVATAKSFPALILHPKRAAHHDRPRHHTRRAHTHGAG